MKERTALDRMRQVMKSVDRFLADTGRYPESLREIPGLGALRDPWGNDYLYELGEVDGKMRPRLWSAGADGQSGTDDDIVLTD